MAFDTATHNDAKVCEPYGESQDLELNMRRDDEPERVPINHRQLGLVIRVLKSMIFAMSKATCNGAFRKLLQVV